jgi:hypothetical protein
MQASHCLAQLTLSSRSPLHAAATRLQARSGETKKKGAGGKFTWGAMLSDASGAPQALDKNDPNYDSDEDAVVKEVALSEGEDDDDEDGPVQSTNSHIVQAVAELKAEVCCRARTRAASHDSVEHCCCCPPPLRPRNASCVITLFWG